MPLTDLVLSDFSGWYSTRSSILSESGRDVYVMRTFRLDFHIGRVECVTCHVPSSHVFWGGVKEVVEDDEDEVEGGRIVMGESIVEISVWYYCYWLCKAALGERIGEATTIQALFLISMVQYKQTNKWNPKYLYLRASTSQPQ